jgi:(R)-2-hydroxyacyl-CoA dehydratese activating ATPase
MKSFAGIDIGSSAIKIVLIDEHAEILAHHASPTGGLFEQNSRQALDCLLQQTGIQREAVSYVLSTGYGRKLFKEADAFVSEITANAVGARNCGDSAGMVRTIINIGGQDSKAIVLDDEGQVKNFAMNDKCAAGTGRFLEMTARTLGIDLAEMGECHKRGAAAPLAINSTCAVFAESEIISLLARGHSREEIIAGVHCSIARRIARLAKQAGIEDTVYFDGGPALNAGMVAALEDELMRPVIVPGMPQIVTAFGAALLARAAWIETGECS